jgi:hypothetical protein
VLTQSTAAERHSGSHLTPASPAVSVQQASRSWSKRQLRRYVFGALVLGLVPISSACGSSTTSSSPSPSTSGRGTTSADRGSSAQPPTTKATVLGTSVTPPGTSVPPTSGTGTTSVVRSSATLSPTTKVTGPVPSATPLGTTVPPTTVDPGCNVLLKLGCRGPVVKQLQTLLRDRGFTTSAIDGDFGPQTSRALQAFEATGCRGCTPDASIVLAGPEWKALESLPPITSPPTTREKSR